MVRFLVIIPAIVIAIVKSNNLPILSAGLTNPSPDHIDISLHTQLKVPPGIKARMDAQTLGLYINKDAKLPYVEVDLPEYHLKGTSDIIVTNQTRSILNHTEFTDFLATALNARNFTIYVKSKTTVHLGALKTKVTINKALKLAGIVQILQYAV